jgi:hypothetical protein
MTKNIDTKDHNSLREFKTSTIEQISEDKNALQRWNALYDAIRRKVFSEINESGEKGCKQ